MMNKKKKNNSNILTMALVAIVTLCISSHFAQAQMTAPGSSSINNDLPSRSGISSDICPEPKQALLNSPDDLAKIQEEITRLNLCVQRAQLLERLNELVAKNIETIDSAIETNFAFKMPEVVIPPITAIEIEGMNSPSQNVITQSSSQPAQEGEWKIKDIKGGNGVMTAILIDEQSNTLSLRKGDKLSNNTTIHSIDATGVQVKKNGKTQRLQWMN